MYVIYEGPVTPGTLPTATDIQYKGPAAGIFKLPLDCLYLNIYNASPHRFTFSFSGGNKDWYFPPNSEAEGIYIGKQGGASLTLSNKMQVAVNLQMTDFFYLTSQATVTGILAIMGFKDGEIWQGKRPLITGSVIPSQGANISSSVINTGNNPGTIMVEGNTSGAGGSLTEYNDGSGSRTLYDAGSFVTVEQYTNGTNLAEAAVQYGTPLDLAVAHFYGDATIRNLIFQTLQSVNGVSGIGIWYPVANANRQHITTNAATNIITISAPITGTYRLNAYFNKLNATSSAITFQYTYTDPDDSATHTGRMSCDVTGTYTNLRGSTGIANVAENCFTQTFNATIGTNITVTWTDPSGTANDYVTAFLDVFVS